MLFFDFEDGVSPAAMTSGELVPCPPGSNSRFCFIGQLNTYKGSTFWNTGTTGTALFQYKDSLVLHFDYWIGAEDAEMSVQISCLYRKRMWGASVRKVPGGRWGHAKSSCAR